MKVIDRLNEIKVFGNDPVSVEKAVAFLYQHRVYVVDLLDEDIPEDLHKAIENFLDNLVYYDGDESQLWKDLLNLDYETLVRMEEFL